MCVNAYICYVFFNYSPPPTPLNTPPSPSPHCLRFSMLLLTRLLGEFTLRAFLNGRLDLSQAENIGRLILAKTVAAADAALAGIQVNSFAFKS